MTDVMGGHIDMGFPTPGESLPLIKANRLRAMAITGLRRLPSLPDIPTFGEAGFPGTELLGWGGLCAPASTPAPIVSKLNELSLAVYLDPKVRPDLERQGYEVGSNTPSEFTAFIQQEITRVTRLAKELQIQPGR
jgi:tripartite-type tricarboxylate transporter receptor subunit TctC